VGRMIYRYGDGYGYGYTYGDGSGCGFGSEEYWKKNISYFSEKWPEPQRERLRQLQESGVTIAYWLSDHTGRACNGGRNDPVTVGTIETVEGPLALCTKGTLHATLLPPMWGGERWWIVALHGEVIGGEEKYGALKREILGEAFT